MIRGPPVASRYPAEAKRRLFLVIPTEVRRIFIADAEASATGIEIFAKHQTSRVLQTDLFLKLKRTHRGDRFEVMMKSRNAHSEIAGSIGIGIRRPLRHPVCTLRRAVIMLCTGGSAWRSAD